MKCKNIRAESDRPLVTTEDQLTPLNKEFDNLMLSKSNNYWSSISKNYYQNLSKSQISQVNSQKFSKLIPNSQSMTVPNLIGCDLNITLSLPSNLSAQPTFVDLDVLRADQLIKDKTVGRQQLIYVNFDRFSERRKRQS